MKDDRLVVPRHVSRRIRGCFEDLAELGLASLGLEYQRSILHAKIAAMSIEDGLRTLISSEQIQQRVQELGRQIEADYPPGPLYLVCILKGSFIFLADLCRSLRRHSVRIEFMGISSYGSGKTSSGQVKVTRDLDVNIENQHVLIVEDIIDSGTTLSYLTRILRERHPKSLEIVTLLDKPDRRIASVGVKYVGFQIPDEFVVGYGLDYAEDYRNLPEIRILTEEG